MCSIHTSPVDVFFDKFELNQTRTFTPATTSFTILLKLQPTVAYATIKCPFGSFLLIWKYHKMWAEKCVNIDSSFSNLLYCVLNVTYLDCFLHGRYTEYYKQNSPVLILGKHIISKLFALQCNSVKWVLSTPKHFSISQFYVVLFTKNFGIVCMITDSYFLN